MNPFATYRRIRRLLNPLGTVTPPAAEGGRPGGEAAAGPSAAPRRDMPESEGDDGSTHAPVEWATARRWRDALSWIGRGGCHEFDYSTCKDFALPCEQWCDSCVALSVLLGADPPTASPQPDPLRSEAARPEPPHGDVRGSGRASHVP